MTDNFHDIIEREENELFHRPEANKFLTELNAADKLRAAERKPPAAALEFAAMEKEKALWCTKDYKFHHREWGQDISDQDNLLDTESALINWISVKDFILKLLSTGHRFFLTDANYPGTLGLWVGEAENSEERKKYVCCIQQPMMPEWGVIRLDEHEKPENWRFKGWRVVLLQLITENILTEHEAHDVFGSADIRIRSRIYRERLFNHRNGH